MEKSIKIEVAHDANSLAEVFQVRKEVFVIEQKVSERGEYDEHETSSTHLAAVFDGGTVGACRFRNTEKGIKLERFAVLKKHRDKGVGAALLQAALHKVDLSQYIYLHAQIQVVDFYLKHGFRKVGDIFEEAGIKHYKMYYKPEST
ncbi:GNAT family N-acetyltransferase [Bacteroidia bacterium]|nr:GNAT family N-acetyltransferase [Bacteroidia bacterium]MDB9882880.1 GNAT family N-acetyltransferase [Bacteroidia bacterium]MDC1395889.1 GNAT family N-acetyltransferase [Bacteroidia bacterium]